MSAIPVDALALVSILNLPVDMANNALWTEHSPLVMRALSEICLEDDYNAACGDDLTPEDAAWVAFRYGYAFMMLASTVEFLNLKTVGEGIVKSVGLDQSATELLTGGEVEAMKDRLELRALSCLRGYLNDSGLARLDELKPRPARLIRVGVI